MVTAITIHRVGKVAQSVSGIPVIKAEIWADNIVLMRWKHIVVVVSFGKVLPYKAPVLFL